MRVDGHAELSPGYVRRAVETLQRTGAVNVGGIQHAVGTTPFERAVADAMTSRFGTGDATFHYGGAEGPTDTVYLGVFDRAALEAAGRYDEALERNQDYELNIRLRQAGGVVWFDPELSVSYRPRGTLRGLARQYFDYGRWKRRVIGRHPRSLRWRQAVPPAVTLTVVGGLLGSAVSRRALLFPTGYAVAVAAAAFSTGSNSRKSGPPAGDLPDDAPVVGRRVPARGTAPRVVTAESAAPQDVRAGSTPASTERTRSSQPNSTAIARGS